MLKRDRTEEEKRIDSLTKRAMMRSWEPSQPSQEASKPNPYTHVLYWDKLGRKGQRCKIIKPGLKIAVVEFEDGHRTAVNRMAIRKG